MTDLDRTLGAMQAHGWEIVRLRGKKPIGQHWPITKDPAEVADWIKGQQQHRVGLPRVAVLDPDKLLPWADMIDDLGQPSLSWVITGSGKLLLHHGERCPPLAPLRMAVRSSEGPIKRNAFAIHF